MVDVRTLAAAVLGVALGILLVIAPGTIISVHTAGRLPQGRHGRYGEDGGLGGRDEETESDETETDGTDAVPSRWRRLVQAVGVVLILGGLYFGWTLV